MSVRIFYVDESFDADRFCLSAIGILHRDWHDAFRAVQEHRRTLKQDHGIFVRKEIHAHELVSGRGRIADRVVNKHTRSRIFHGLLQVVAALPDVVVINVCLEQKGRRDAQLDAWDRLINRIERAMSALETREIGRRMGLSSRLLDADPKLKAAQIRLRLLRFAPRAIIVADQSREQEITKAFRKKTVFNPIPSKFGAWSTGQSKNIPIKRIIEDPVFKPSHQSFFIQLADCVAFALLKKEAPQTPLVAKYQLHKFFAECLAKVCLKKASPKDPLGIVRN